MNKENYKIIQDEQDKHHNLEHARQSKHGHSWWLNDDNSSTWSHYVCMNDIKNFFKCIPASSFLVLGDGSGGRESRFISNFGHDVLSTDTCTISLKQAFEKKLIEKYEYCNVEDIKYDNNSFDYVFIKETLHHVPRPYLGIYEMIRVAKKAVIIIEPHVQILHDTYLGYEECGNYSYRFNQFDFMQVAASLKLQGISYTFSHNPETFSLDGMYGDISIFKENANTIMSNIDKKNGVSSRALLTTFILKDMDLSYLDNCNMTFKIKDNL